MECRALVKAEMEEIPETRRSTNSHMEKTEGVLLKGPNEIQKEVMLY